MNLSLEKVQNNFINPLVEMYNKTLNDYQIQAFVEDLSRFTEYEMRGAVKKIRSKNRYFPTISESIEACYFIRDELVSKNQSIKKQEKFPWEERQKAAQVMAKDYIENYQKTAVLWEQAMREGWELALYQYIWSIAHLQSCLIHKVAAGWDKESVFGINAILTDETLNFWLDR